MFPERSMPSYRSHGLCRTESNFIKNLVSALEKSPSFIQPTFEFLRTLNFTKSPACQKLGHTKSKHKVTRLNV